jgi:hypothetical protein
MTIAQTEAMSARFENEIPKDILDGAMRPLTTGMKATDERWTRWGGAKSENAAIRQIVRRICPPLFGKIA